MIKGVDIMLSTDKMTRKEFLKKTFFGLAAFTLAGKASIGNISTAVNSDTIESMPKNVGMTPPENTDTVWVDTSAGGIMKYFDGVDWVPVKSTWG